MYYPFRYSFTQLETRGIPPFPAESLLSLALYPLLVYAATPKWGPPFWKGGDPPYGGQFPQPPWLAGSPSSGGAPPAYGGLNPNLPFGMPPFFPPMGGGSSSFSGANPFAGGGSFLSSLFGGQAPNPNAAGNNPSGGEPYGGMPSMLPFLW